MTARHLRVLHVLGELRASGAEVMMAVAAPTFAELGVSIEIARTCFGVRTGVETYVKLYGGG